MSLGSRPRLSRCSTPATVKRRRSQSDGAPPNRLVCNGRLGPEPITRSVTSSMVVAVSQPARSARELVCGRFFDLYRNLLVQSAVIRMVAFARLPHRQHCHRELSSKSDVNAPLLDPLGKVGTPKCQSRIRAFQVMLCG